jgi:hypothetical protein
VGSAALGTLEPRHYLHLLQDTRITSSLTRTNHTHARNAWGVENPTRPRARNELERACAHTHGRVGCTGVSVTLGPQWPHTSLWRSNTYAARGLIRDLIPRDKADRTARV